MAAGTIFLETKLRPCYVKINEDEVKALFHGWDYQSYPIEPSPMVGGHPGGVMAYTQGIVEMIHGEVKTVNPNTIRFADTCFENYIWGR